MKEFNVPVKDQICTVEIPFTTPIPLVGENIVIEGKDYEVADIQFLSAGTDSATYQFTVLRPKSIIIMMGPPGSGKTTYCATNLPTYQRVSQDEQGKKGYLKVFERMLANGVREIVVDRMNQNKQQRAKFLNAAKLNGYSTTIIFLHTPTEVCRERIEARKNHKFEARDCQIALGVFNTSFESPTKDEADQLIFKG